MKKFTTNILKFVSVAMLLGIVTPIYAESAPVYDVDSMPQQFDNGIDQQDLPAPPAPEGDTFVPAQSMDQPDVTAPLGTSSPAITNAPSGTVPQRLRRVEQQINNMQLSDRGLKLDALQQQVQTLRGQVEQMMHDLQIINAQQKKLYDDLDKRVQAISAATSAAAVAPVAAPAAVTTTKTKTTKTTTLKSSDASGDDSTADAPAGSAAATTTPDDGEPGLTPSSKTAKPAPKPAAKPAAVPTSAAADTQPNVAEEQQIYQTAYNYIKAKQYNEAVDALQGMLKKYPSGQFAANAHYWLGELYGLLNKHDLAQKEFSTVIKTFPSSPRVSDAQLKVGLILAAQSKWPDAKTAFKSVINHYPGTASARLASEQLKEIKIAGH